MDTNTEIQAFTILAPLIITYIAVVATIGFSALAKHVYDIKKQERAQSKSVAKHHKID